MRSSTVLDPVLDCLARAGWHWRTQRWLRVGAIAVLALAAALVVGSVQHGASDARRVAEPDVVVVARRRVAAGRPVAGALALEARPASDVPDGALRTLPDGEAIARTEIVAGEVVVTERIAPQGASALAAQLASDERAVAIPLGDASVAVEPGDAVDLLGILDVATSTVSRTVATGTVLDVADGSVTVAVAAGDLPDVATALGQGQVTVALRPAP